MNYYTVSLNFVQHDTSIAVFNHDELIFFHQSERMTRRKHDHLLHIKVLDDIFENITKTIDLLTIGPHAHDNYEAVNYLRNKFSIKKMILSWRGSNECIKLSKQYGVFNFTHHSSHALSAFYMSPFDEAVCLVMDAIGSDYTFPDEAFLKTKKIKEHEGIRGHETTSIFEVSKNYRLKPLYKKSQVAAALLITTKENELHPIAHIGGSGMRVFHDNPFERFKNFKFKFDPSYHLDIGCMYQAVTYHVGFGGDGSGKLMGLSAYGKEDPSLPPFLMNDTIHSNLNLFLPGRELNYRLYPELFGDLTFEKKANLAYAMQKALEKSWVHHVQFIKEKSNIRNLVIGGGCALNILGVSLIKQKFPEFNIFVDPIAHDATHAIGEGIHFYNLLHAEYKLEKRNVFKSIYLGPKYDENVMNKEINDYISNYSK